MNTKDIVTFLAHHGIKHKIEDNQIFAEDSHICKGKEKICWFPVTGATERELLEFILSD
jgi:hypothetical protein